MAKFGAAKADCGTEVTPNTSAAIAAMIMPQSMSAFTFAAMKKAVAKKPISVTQT